MKEFFSFLMALVLGSQVSAAFPDVLESSEYYDAINYVQSENIVQGYPNGNYQPEQSINRAEFVKIISESVFSDEDINACDRTIFPDVPQNEWFTKYVCIAYENQLIQGYPDGTFQPASSINFVESAKIWVEAQNVAIDTNTDPWYQSYVEYLGQRNAIPTTIPTFEHRISRGQMAEMVYRIRADVNNKDSQTYATLAGITDSNGEQNEESPSISKNTTGIPLTLPENFSISTFAENLSDARDMIFDGQGNILVSRPDAGVITQLEIANGEVQNQKDILTELTGPHGLALDPQDSTMLYYAEENAVSRIRLNDTANPEKLADLPAGGRHTTRSLIFGPDNRLYVSIGSACDVCEEEDARRAAVYVMNKDGSNFESFATGLRNSVFMNTDPVTGKIWATDMGRDMLGDNLPPDEINILQAGDFGWPICYGKNIHDTQFDTRQYIQDPCTERFPSHIDLQAHSAPLGLAIVPEEGWPEDYRLDLIVAFHGSWNRSEPTGYKLVHIDLDPQTREMTSIEDFITGFRNSQSGQVYGRPAGLLIQPGGILYISDDEAGKIYKLSYVAKSL